MNNEELKKKICKIIADNYLPKEMPDRLEDYKLYRFARAADALIDANIFVDIDTLKDEQQSMNGILTNMSSYMKYKLHELKHRAEVAERALDLCETAYILSLHHRATEGISGQAIASDLGVHKFFMEQAEKELAEEGKND